jgi:hypothetical protein
MTDEAVSASPGIQVKLLTKGTVLLLEGETDLYELTVRYPEYGIVEVDSNHPAIRQSGYGQFTGSVRAGQPGFRSSAIKKGWAIMLRFRNGEFLTQPILAARVCGVRDDGSRWSYDVF